MKKHTTAHIIFAVTAIASQPVWALGFGRVVPDAVLGQSLTFTVPVHVEAGERFGADCVSAQVFFGDAVLPPNLVRTSVDRGNGDNQWLVRVTTLAPVEEPVVEIAVSAGCERRFERRFTAFADPPSLPAQPGQPAVIAQAGTSAGASSTAGATAPAPLAGTGTGTGTDSGNGTGNGRAGGAGGARAAGRGASASAAADARPRVIRKGPTMALANALRTPTPRHGAAAAPADAAPGRHAGPRAAPTPTASAAHLVLDGGFSRLKLDMDEPLLPPPLSAASAATLADADDPNARQVQALETNIQAMKRAEQAHRNETARLQAQLADAQSQGDWTTWLLILLALAVAAIALLAWRLRQQARLAHSAWFNESQLQAAPAAAVAAVPAVVVKPAAVAPAAMAATSDAGPPSIGGELVGEPLVDELSDSQFDEVIDVSATAPLDRAALAGMMAGESSIPRELSVEELLDLEQQADFFIALGQEDAAVDLLMSHLRSAGGQSPLPYTKLLEIYRRQDDRSAYERTRARFNRRFNAYAPDWDTGPTAGRLLEDYPETIARLQSVWHAPIDAMAILEAQLFKRDDQAELFDLPAYRDILLLYSLARDLWQQEGSGGAQVDVLLPLDDAGFAAFQAPAPHAQFAPAGPATAPAPLSANDLPSLPEPDSFLMTSYQMPDTEAEAGTAAWSAPVQAAPVPVPPPASTPAPGSMDLDLDLPGLSLDLPPAPPAPATPAPKPSTNEDEPVHLTLDAFSLTPIEPPKAPPPASDWELGDPSSADSPPSRKR